MEHGRERVLIATGQIKTIEFWHKPQREYKNAWDKMAYRKTFITQAAIFRQEKGKGCAMG